MIKRVFNITVAMMAVPLGLVTLLPKSVLADELSIQIGQHPLREEIVFIETKENPRGWVFRRWKKAFFRR
ncbi:hypothetical protein NIES4071_55860 [Calothrix sp. NIES-4071]|nr:hypothetical protein NIES4071_55860 [Calothrix sp. NIES-4071]BAZ59893.1 hypothetical protein NIES4105_55810 [Calothrix sp. NIES-4105]